MSKFKIGEQVRIVKGCPSSESERFNRNGDIGTITEIDKTDAGSFMYRVTVPSKCNFGNWSSENHLELEPTRESTQEYLKSIGMEDQMLRQLIMTMPIEDVMYWYLERIKLEKQKVNNQ